MANTENILKVADDEHLGCDYTGFEFGGGYIDSACIDGYLWDLDSCDEPGGGLTHGGEWACPIILDFRTDPRTAWAPISAVVQPVDQFNQTRWGRK